MQIADQVRHKVSGLRVEQPERSGAKVIKDVKTGSRTRCAKGSSIERKKKTSLWDGIMYKGGKKGGYQQLLGRRREKGQGGDWNSEKKNGMEEKRDKPPQECGL